MACSIRLYLLSLFWIFFIFIFIFVFFFVHIPPTFYTILHSCLPIILSRWVRFQSWPAFICVLICCCPCTDRLRRCHRCHRCSKTARLYRTPFTNDYDGIYNRALAAVVLHPRFFFCAPCQIIISFRPAFSLPFVCFCDVGVVCWCFYSCGFLSCSCLFVVYRT